MPVRLRCQCGQSLSLPEQKAGLRVQCPVCNEYLTIPTGPPAKAAAAEVSTAAEAGNSSRNQQKREKPQARKQAAARAKEQPLAPPPAKATVPAPPRPEPRVPAPRAAPQPPPRKAQLKPESAMPTPAPPPRAPSATGGAKPPPLPVAKYATTAASAPTPPPAPVPAPPAVTPSIAAIEPKTAVEKRDAVVIQPQPKPAAPREKSRGWFGSLKRAATAPLPEAKTPAETATERLKPLRGVEHDPAKRYTVYQLGFGLAVLALASSYPAVMEIVRHVRDPLSTGIENWTYLLVVISVIELVYALYLVQLPDWSSVWVTMIVTSIVSTVYAIGMGMSLMARPDNEVLAVLGLSQLHSTGHLTLWCLLLTMLTALLSYSMVRTSVKWHKMFELAMVHAQE